MLKFAKSNSPEKKFCFDVQAVSKRDILHSQTFPSPNRGVSQDVFIEAQLSRQQMCHQAGDNLDG